MPDTQPVMGRLVPAVDKPNQVLLPITRAQLDALRWCAKPLRQSRDERPPTRALDSLTSKRLARAIQRGYFLAQYRLTPAGRALLRALDLLYPLPRRRRR